MTVLTPLPTAAPATDIPTAVLRRGAVLHRVRAAAAAVWRLDPGRYLALPDGDEVVVTRLRGVTRIGRRTGADVVLDDATVSRRHALVIEREGDAIIADDRSRNGLFVNGIRVRQARLRNGDEIQLGALVMRFLEVQPQPR